MFILGHEDDASDTIFALNLQCNNFQKDISIIRITFMIPPAYPNQSPHISLRCTSITKERILDLKNDIDKYKETLIGKPMVFDIINWIKENINDYFIIHSDKITTQKSVFTCGTALLHLDHMRNRIKYSKTISRWAAELSLTGRLIICDRIIVILLQGSLDNIKVEAYYSICLFYLV